jgi:hypothetical protein
MNQNEMMQLYAVAASNCTHFYTAHTRFKTWQKEQWKLDAYKVLASKALHKFHNVLVRRIHGYDYKKNPDETEIVMLTSVEVAGSKEGVGQTVHVHILLGRLNGKNFNSTELSEIKSILDDAWQRTDVFGKVTHLEETYKNQELGALMYSDKGRTKQWFGEGVNFDHCWLPKCLFS